ncbi:MAG TPA: hypothetical protein VFE24_05745 [Pirellulales bacterium]|jgi:hypothetical protein|nr:hypothetical protein [Pirellulales bacterium]
MRLARFLTDLFESGHVRLSGETLDLDDEEEAEAGAEVERILAEREAAVAKEFPAPVPPLDGATAVWAARQFYTACFFVLHRAALPAEMQAALSEAGPEGERSAQHYAIDLVWRFLPDLDRLTATLAPHDPLREILRSWGNAWPLSSVGVPGCEPSGIAEILAHRGLRQAYIDRIIERNDASRLREAAVLDLVKAALGDERFHAAAWCNQLAIAASGGAVEKSPAAAQSDLVHLPSATERSARLAE